MVQSKVDLRKSWKDAIKKTCWLLARGLKISDTQDRVLGRLDSNNWPTPACGKNKPGSRKTKLIVNIRGANGC